MRTNARAWVMGGVFAAFIAACLPPSAAFADPPQASDPRSELERKREQRFQEQLQRAREADRVRETDRARRLKEVQERDTQAIEHTRESRDSARERKEREDTSLQAAREADRERTARRARSRRDRDAPAPPAR